MFDVCTCGVVSLLLHVLLLRCAALHVNPHPTTPSQHNHTGCFGLDIGPQTASAFSEAMLRCKTLFWNGPMGRFEVPGFAAGTHTIARAMGAATAAGATTVIGGGWGGLDGGRVKLVCIFLRGRASC